MNEDIKERVMKLLAKAVDRKVDLKSAGPNSSLRDDLGLDSLAAVELTTDLEDEFHVTFRDFNLADLKTLGDVYGLIESNLGKP